MEVDITDVNYKDKNDGTDDLIYTAKSTGVLEIDDGASIVRTVDRQSQGQKTRFAIELFYNEHNGEPGYEFIQVAMNKEDFYDYFHDRLRSQLPNIARYLFTKP